jgi:hypothetical protein
VFPDPATDQVTVLCEGNTPSLVRITDMTGREVLRRTLTQRAELNVAQWPRGTYFVRIDDAKGTRCAKLVLE